jgi:plasmid stabilization system protein ParE
MASSPGDSADERRLALVQTMSAYVLSALAKADIFAIWCYIADDSEEAAGRVEQAIYDACALVAESPGRAIPGVTSRPERFFSGQ